MLTSIGLTGGRLEVNPDLQLSTILWLAEDLGDKAASCSSTRTFCVKYFRAALVYYSYNWMAIMAGQLISRL